MYKHSVNDIKIIEEKIGYTFSNKRLLEEALTHSSFANESGGSFFNERLEFLGDAVLELVSSERIFCDKPDLNEGKMTLLRSKLVCKNSLCNWCRYMQLDKYIRIGKCLRKTGATDSICADALEAVFGAVFLDGGFNPAKRVISVFLEKQSYLLEEKLDPKTDLQQRLQALGLGVPYYKTLDRKGPEHDLNFRVAITLDNKIVATAWGKTIHDAEFSVARKVLDEDILNLNE